MRVFSKPGSFDRLSLEARCIYSFFCVFMLVGYASNIWLYYDDGMRLNAASATRYYLGEENTHEERPQESKGEGAVIVLPDSYNEGSEKNHAEELRIEKPARQVIETFHFHLYSMSVCFLVLAHLFMMCRFETRTKVIIIVLGGLSTLAHLFLPLMIRFVSPVWSLGMGPSAIVLSLTWLFMTVWPLLELWLCIPERTQKL